MRTFVNYPKNLKDTGEGGLITHLYVLDHKDYIQKWEECCDDCEFWDFSRMHFSEDAKGWYQGNDEMSKVTPEDLERRQILLAMKFASINQSLWNENTGQMFA